MQNITNTSTESLMFVYGTLTGAGGFQETIFAEGHSAQECAEKIENDLYSYYHFGASTDAHVTDDGRIFVSYEDPNAIINDTFEAVTLQQLKEQLQQIPAEQAEDFSKYTLPRAHRDGLISDDAFSELNNTLQPKTHLASLEERLEALPADAPLDNALQSKTQSRNDGCVLGD